MKGNENSAFSTFKKQVQSAIEDLKTKGKRHRQIPNLLTLMRLTAPCFIIPAAAVGSVPLVLGLTAFFSLTDLADGFIARHWKLTSELGETLDAVTDKVFASTLLLAASFANPILLLNLGLECGIAAINTHRKLNNEPVKSSMVGKAKTWFLFGLVGVGFISPYFEMNNILNNLSFATSAMQVFTIASYLTQTSDIKKLLKDGKEENTSVIIPNDNDIEPTELQKEKILDVDTSIPKVQAKEREDLKQLKAMRDFLVSEQTFLETEQTKPTDSINYEKSKKDDFNKN